jgi:hypothetical protein
MKTRIIKQLGQTDVVLPALVMEALTANNRIKVRLDTNSSSTASRTRPVRPPSSCQS